MFLDSGFIIFVLPAMLLALWAQSKVNSAYETYSRMMSSNGLPGRVVAESLLRNAGLGDVRIEKIDARLGDHYDPRKRVLRLSSANYDSPSVAAVAVAAHEVGHAVQQADGYAPLGIRNGLVPVARLASSAALPLFLIGYFMGAGSLMDVGILFFLGAVVFQVITLPVEFNASRRAVEMLETSGLARGEDLQPIGSMLNAAALTYIAATAVAVAQLLRLVLLRDRRR